MEGVLDSDSIDGVVSSGTTVVLNGTVYSFTTGNPEAEADKNVLSGDKFVSLTSIANPSVSYSLITDTDSQEPVIIDTSRGLVLSSVNDGIHVPVGHHINLGNADLTAAAHLLGQNDSILEDGHAQLFNIKTDHAGDIILGQSLDPTDAIELPPVFEIQTIAYASDETKGLGGIEVPKKKGGWPKGRKRKKEKEVQPPKAPLTGYVMYSLIRRPVIKENHPSLSFTEVTRLLGNEWSIMSQDAKQKYLNQAEADKRRYMEELKAYQQSETYQNILRKRKARIIVNDDDPSSLDGILVDSTEVNDLEEDGLYCKVCNQYFSSIHNRKEHMFGKQHLQAITHELEKELQQSEEQSEPLTPDLGTELLGSDQGLLGSFTSRCDEAVDIESFIQQFMEKNHNREAEIRELRQSLAAARTQNSALVEKINEYRVHGTKLEQDIATMKHIGSTLASKMDTLRMVPTLFGVVNFGMLNHITL